MAPTRPIDRWLALAVLLLPLLLLHVLVVRPLWAVPMAEARGRMEALRERELRLRTERDQADAVAGRFADVVLALDGVPGFLPYPGSEQASAALLQQVEQVVAEVSPGQLACRVSARTPLPADAATAAGEPFTRVAVQVRLRCGAAELVRVLDRLETGSPRLFVDNLGVTATGAVLLPGESGAGVDAGFDLYGYLDPTQQPVAEVGDAH